MTSTEHFQVIDDAASPVPWMQLRLVASAETPNVSRSYDVSGGANKNELVQTLQTQWTNNTPMNQWVYGRVTRGGAAMALQARTRGYLSTYHGWKIAPDPVGTIDMIEVSKFGVGSDAGSGGLLALGSGFAVARWNENSSTIPFLAGSTGWFLIEPGEKFNARVEVRFLTEFWENTPIDGGETGSDSSFSSGDLRLDLWALPTVAVALPRTVPTVVGGAGNIQSDINVDFGLGDVVTSVTKPTGLAAGDVLLAFAATNSGLSTELNPVDSGWSQLQNIDAGWLDVHMKIYARTVTNPVSEPAHYDFTNGLFAEGITAILALRGVAPFDSIEGANWYLATNVSRWKMVEEQVAPSIARSGQLLLCVSYIAHESSQAPLTQTPPTGMTELADINGGASTMAVAVLASPPNPTADRQFAKSSVPLFSGHSITAAILVPGEQTFA